MKIKLENSYKKDYKNALKQGILGESELVEFDKIIKALTAGQALDKRIQRPRISGRL